jgi:hypothetical protein
MAGLAKEQSLTLERGALTRLNWLGGQPPSFYKKKFFWLMED